MHARLVRFRTAPGARAVVQALSDDLTPAITSEPGCKDVTVFGNEDTGEWGLYVLWGSYEEAMAAAHVIRPRLDAHLKGLAVAPPETQLFEVLSR